MAGKIDLDVKLAPDADQAILKQHIAALLGDIPERLARIEGWMKEEKGKG